MIQASCTFVAVLCISASVFSATPTTEMDELFASWNEKSVKPGLAVAVMHNGKDVYSKCFGLANLEYGIKLSEKSVFDTASVAKQFTGFAVATLIEEGRLTMDDPIRKYLPELNELHEPIKIHHLAHHTSGLRDVANLFDVGGFGHDSTATQALDLIKIQRGFNFEAGKEYDYSNSNYVLLALIVERITKQSFPSWCDENLFKECGMDHSFANDNSKRIARDRAVAYYGQEPHFTFDQNNGMALIGSSAVYSTLSDMRSWVRHLSKTRSSKTTQRMMTPGKLDDGKAIEYGLGLAIHPHRGTTMVEHSGATPSGFRTQVALFPEHDFAFVILSNWGDIDVVGDYGKRIIDIYLGEHLAEEGASPAEEQIETIELPSESLEKLGNYLFNGEANVTIAVNDGGLELELEGRGKMKVEPMSKSRLYMEALRSFLQFDDDWQEATVYEGDRKIGNLKRKAKGGESAPTLKQLSGRYFNDEMNLLFTVDATEEKLTLHKSATASHELVHRTGDRFRAADWSFTSVVFKRGANGSVEGMDIAAGNRLRNVSFKRMK